MVIREPYRDGRVDTWTGTGFMKTPEKSFIEFTVDNIKRTMEYEIAIRYEQPTNENWDEVVVEIVRPGPIDPNSPCAQNYNPADDIKRLSLDGNSRSIIVHPPVCLEAGQIYKIRLEFKRSKYDRDTPSASVLIDSVSSQCVYWCCFTCCFLFRLC